MLAYPALRPGLAAAAVAAFASAPAGAQPASPAPAANPLVDFYTADRSATDVRAQYELRLRDDGRAWLVSAPTEPSAQTPGTFETGTWRADGGGVRVVLETIANVENGAPAAERPEQRVLSFSAASCALTLVATQPANALGAPGFAFAKRRCP